MVSVGAITRLTQSGLSITEWKPLMGAIPPLNNAEWHRVFELYQHSPEFLKKNSWMKLDDFKRIFFWEWSHRFLGRLIGVAYGLPLLWFLARREMPKGYGWKLFGVLIVGGMQGVLGWYMVMSGLVDRPEVSHYRLAAHLFLALLIYASMVWLGLSLRETNKREGDRKLFVHTLITLALVLVTMCWGAFTAGLKGGLIYNDSFPMMGKAWIPPEAHTSVISNPAGAQFLHRWLAISSLIMVCGLWAHAYARGKLSIAITLVGLMVFVQVALGIATLFGQVWIPLAAMHQAGAVTLMTLLIIAAHPVRGR